MIGFGNPLLDGYPGGPTHNAEAAQIVKDHAQWAAEARAHRQCPETLQQVAAHTVGHVSVARIQTRRRLVDVPYLRRQAPLPETVDELCTVAHAVPVRLQYCGQRSGDAEALSGSARAFAQARALRVSHWAVYSNATVSLITAAVSEMARDTRVDVR